jgi:hypothetical protein
VARLTPGEAQAEARWRWGGLFVRGFARYTGAQPHPFEVGTVRFGSMTVRGRGTTWESAFKNADARTNARKSRAREDTDEEATCD